MALPHHGDSCMRYKRDLFKIHQKGNVNELILESGKPSQERRPTAAFVPGRAGGGNGESDKEEGKEKRAELFTNYSQLPMVGTMDSNSQEPSHQASLHTHPFPGPSQRV